MFEAQLSDVWRPARIIDRGFRRTEIADAGRDLYQSSHHQAHRSLQNPNPSKRQGRHENGEDGNGHGASRQHHHTSDAARSKYQSVQGFKIGQQQHVPQLQLRDNEEEARLSELQAANPLEKLRYILFRRGPRIAVSLKRQLLVVDLNKS